jgi:hypothetical protein
MAEDHGILDGTNIDFSVFSFGAPKTHEKARVVNVVNKNTKQSVEIATPLILTWGAQEGKDDNGNATGKWTIALQFPTKEYSTPETEAFLANMRALEERVKVAAMENSRDWFGKAISNMELINDKMNDMLRHPKVAPGSAEKDTTRPPTLTVKLPCWKGSWRSEVFDEDGNPLFVPGKINAHMSPVEYINKQAQVACVLQCGGVWLVNGKFSIIWNLKQAVVQKPKARVEGKCLISLKSHEKEAMKKQVVEADVMDDGGATSAFLEDDDVPAVPTSVFKTGGASASASASASAAPVEAMDTEEPSTPTVAATAAATAEEPKKVVKKIVKKKTDA